ncbi:hypothetical protein RJ639_017258 [Escallonia herrerae]|uniref:Uncharacterized protein n=1 Tax=Escallonia herrerae TaxID=1293975 RepID=A0AA88VE20_9ASTE|nr:hypothetical protein RJ639_017258 [Escallonia herrerae]
MACARTQKTKSRTRRGVYSTSLNLANECTYTVWPAVVSGHRTPPLTTTIFMLEPGESASLLIPPSWSCQLWARTLCSYGLTGRFNCLTGNCGTGSEECPSAQTVSVVTVAEIGLRTQLPRSDAQVNMIQPDTLLELTHSIKGLTRELLLSDKIAAQEAVCADV